VREELSSGVVRDGFWYAYSQSGSHLCFDTRLKLDRYSSAQADLATRTSSCLQLPWLSMKKQGHARGVLMAESHLRLRRCMGKCEP